MIPLLRTEYAEEWIPVYVCAMLQGAIAELKIVQQKTLEGGSMSTECRTEAKAQYHHDTLHDSMACEEDFGIAKVVADAMPCGSGQRHMARTNNRASKCMLTYKKVSAQEARAIWITTRAHVRTHHAGLLQNGAVHA